MKGPGAWIAALCRRIARRFRSPVFGSRMAFRSLVEEGKPQEELDTAVATRRFESERWRVRKDGSRYWASLMMSAARSSSGGLLGSSEISRDISDRTATEANRGLLEAVPTGRW